VHIMEEYRDSLHSKLERLITSPDIVPQYERVYLGKKASDLSYCRWTLDRTEQSFSNTLEYRKAMIEMDDSDNLKSSSLCVNLNDRSHEQLNWNYLTLRQVQNTNRAEDRLRRGNELANSVWNSDIPDVHMSSNILRKAEECYKDGLDMAPHHSGLLHSYGILCYKERRLEQAYDLLNQALSVSATEESKEIHVLLSIIGKKLGLASMAAELFTHTTANMTLSGRAENALKDAMAEKDLLFSHVENIIPIEDAHKSIENGTSSSSASSSSSSSSTNRRRKKRNKRKHHKTHRTTKKRKRSRHKKGRRRKGSREGSFSGDDDRGS